MNYLSTGLVSSIKGVSIFFSTHFHYYCLFVYSSHLDKIWYKFDDIKCEREFRNFIFHYASFVESIEFRLIFMCFLYWNDRKCSRHIRISMSSMWIFLENYSISSNQWICHIYDMRDVSKSRSTASMRWVSIIKLKMLSPDKT